MSRVSADVFGVLAGSRRVDGGEALGPEVVEPGHTHRHVVTERHGLRG